MRDDTKNERSFAFVNRHFANYPLARDARVTLHWRKSKKTGRWLCDLPGGSEVQLRLPHNTPAVSRRWPSALDMNMLFLLMSEATRRKARELEFPSLAYLLRSLGYSPEARNRRKLKDALALWSNLTIWYANWRYPNVYKFRDADGRVHDDWEKGAKKFNQRSFKYERRQLPPPIELFDTASKRLRIVLDQEWIALSKRFFVRVPLPLPREATAQNLALAVLTSHYVLDKSGVKMTRPRRVRKLCHKIGLDHHNRAVKLRRALSVVQDWFEQHGGELIGGPPGSNKIRFVILKDVRMGGRKPNPSVEATAPPCTVEAQFPEALDDEVGMPADDEAQWKAEFDADMEARGIRFDDATDAEAKYEVWLRRKLELHAVKDDDGRGRLMAVTNDERGRRR